MPAPSPEILNELLCYDPETGFLFWKRRPKKFFKNCNGKAWNKQFSGKQAFTAIDGKGYHVGAVFNHIYRAHRVIWAMETGAWPVGDIDHIDHNRTNNKIANLRDVSKSANSKNQKPRGVTKSGVTGVYKNKDTGRWYAQISINGKSRNIGTFDTVKEAWAARQKKKSELGYHPNHGE